MLTLGFVMVVKCFVTNKKLHLDAVEQCHDE